MVKRNIDIAWSCSGRIPQIYCLQRYVALETILFQKNKRFAAVVDVISVVFRKEHIIQVHIRVWIKIYVLHRYGLLALPRPRNQRVR